MAALPRTKRDVVNGKKAECDHAPTSRVTVYNGLAPGTGRRRRGTSWSADRPASSTHRRSTAWSPRPAERYIW
ncbi:protein of unknown function [Methanoculleus bourgensis]|uniref:Uncharacterized protein n=1 Tax=Methanoculleus bourgensis TaxID=83986 RepID=A0A0X8XYG5_9EURY|nr:protein of unknown function [Methanoculleus bourgensis]